MNSQKHTDASAKIEYQFWGFDHVLTDQEKKDLIARHGKPRRRPFGIQEFKSGPIIGTIDFGQIWEDQIILRTPPDSKTNSPEQIRAEETQDIFSRMVATD